MKSRCRKHIRIKVCQNGGHRRARGQSGDKGAAAVEGELSCQFARKGREDFRLAGTAWLIGWFEPVPAGGRVAAHRLGRIGDGETVLFGQSVRMAANREIVWRLVAAVQHKDQNLWLLAGR